MGVLYQMIGTFVVCSLTMNTGIIFAWPSATAELFKSANSPLSRPLTAAEEALLGSIASVGALLGTPAVAALLDRLGRKKCCLLCGLMNVIGWAMVAVSRRAEVALAAMLVAGLGGAGFLVVAVYVAEFCQDSIRGAMSSGSMVMYGVGMLLAYITGGLLDYWGNVYACLTLAVVSLAMLCWLRESPLFLLMKGREKEAAASVAFYRRLKTSSKEVVEELDTLRRAINAEKENVTPEEKKLQPAAQEKKLNLWQFFKKSRATRRALLVALTLMTASIFQGLVVVQVYAAPLFARAAPALSPTLATVAFALINVAVGFVAAYLTETCGRRPLIIYPSLGAAASCAVCGLQLLSGRGPGWLVPASIYAFATFFALGAATVPFVVLAEIFVPEVKSYMTMIIVEWTWLCNFLILVVFEPLSAALGLGAVFLVFAGACLATAAFSARCLPETRGLPLHEIQALLVPHTHTTDDV